MRVAFGPELAIVAVLMIARIGTMVMLLPGISERAFGARFRLSAALLIVLVLFPVARPYYPGDLGDVTVMIPLLIGELLVGFVLGMTGRFLLSSLTVAGGVISQQLGLGFVTTVDPTQGQQGALLGSFMSLVGVTLIFATDLHHLALGALGRSYDIFRPGAVPGAGDAGAYAVRLVEAAFRVGVQISAPILVFGLVFNVGLGILSRLMPQMQVFFVGVPASILLGMAILLMAFAAVMGVFLESVETGLAPLLPGR